MAIQQVVPISILLLGDGVATVFVFALGDLYQISSGSAVPYGNLGVVPSAVAPSNSNPPGAINIIQSATIDANGNITVTLTEPLPAGQIVNYVLNLLFDSGDTSVFPLVPQVFISGATTSISGSPAIGALNVTELNPFDGVVYQGSSPWIVSDPTLEQMSFTASGSPAQQSLNVNVTNPLTVTFTESSIGVTQNSTPWVVGGTVAVSNFPLTIAVSNFPATQPVSGTFWQSTQPVSGTFWQATQPVSGTFWQTTQPVSGTVAVSNFPATQPVSGTVAISNPFNGVVSGTVAVSNFPASQVVTLASTTITNFPASVAVTGTFWPTTQPVSGTFWQATQPVSGTVAVSNPFNGAVTGTFWQATQPVSIASMPSTPVTGTFWQATQPISGAISFTAPQHVITDTGSVTSLGNTTGKTLVMKTATTTTTAATADQVVLTYTVTAAKTFYLEYLHITPRLTVAPSGGTAVNPVNIGFVSLESPAGTKLITVNYVGPQTEHDTITFAEPIPIAAGVVVRVVCTPDAVTSTQWSANFGGYEK
jgi:hypothetical protein